MRGAASRTYRPKTDAGEGSMRETDRSGRGNAMSERSERIDVTALREASTERSEGVQ